MKAVVLEGPEQWRIGEVADPIPAADEVVLDIAGCGVCGTDLHTLGGSNPNVRFPITPGHEFIGTVTAVGDSVIDLKPGDRVAVDPSRSCGRCRFCLSGHANVCPRKGGYGSRYSGGFGARAAVRETSCVLLPDGLGWRTAILAEPLACVLNGVQRIERIAPVLGADALVLGGGTIGLLVAYALSAAGARVTVSEPVEARREIGAAIGLADLVDPADLDLDARWDVVVDATGVAPVIEQGATLLQRGGTFLIMGVASPDARISISPHLVNWQELNIIGSSSVNQTFAKAVDFLASAPHDLGLLVTRLVPLDDFGAAIEGIRSREALKIAVLPAGSDGW